MFSSSDRRWVWEIGFFLIVAAMAAYFTSLYFYLNQQFEVATLQKLVAGHARKPFQYRILSPFLVGVISDWTGARLMRVAFGYIGVAVALLIYAFRLYVAAVARNKSGLHLPRRIVAVMALSVGWILPFNYLLPPLNKVWYIYDIPSLVFITIGLYLLYEKKWFYFYPIFLLACLNRETCIALPLVLLVCYYDRLSKKKLAAHLIGQLGILFATRAAIMNVFATNAGPGFEYRLKINLNILTSFDAILLLFSSFGFLALVVLLCWRNIEDEFVRRSQLVVFPFLGFLLVGGNILELRIFGEMIPVLLSGFWLILFGGWSEAEPTLPAAQTCEC